MSDLAALSWPALCAAAFALGARHALDADHLTVIDAIARRNAASRPRLAASGGLLFSLGHVAVVAAVALVTVWSAEGATAPPAWLATTGLLISAVVLVALGLANLRSAWSAPAGSYVPLVGWKARLAADGDHPAIVATAGALFAVSFDTIALALGIGLAGKAIGGLAWALVGAACFGAGMMLVGGANGLWVVHLLRSASRHAAVASRLMAAAIGLLNLAIGLLAVSTLFLASADAWRERNGALLSGLVIAGCIVAFLAALWLGRSRSAARPLLSAAAMTGECARP